MGGLEGSMIGIFKPFSIRNNKGISERIKINHPSDSMIGMMS
jgi:hypothetical protein